MGVLIRQVWGDVEVIVTNPLPRDAWIGVNLYSPKPWGFTDFGGVGTLRTGETRSKVYPKSWLPVAIGDSVYALTFESDGAHDLATFHDTSNIIVYQVLAVPAAVIIIPAGIIIGVAMIKFIK